LVLKQVYEAFVVEKQVFANVGGLTFVTPHYHVFTLDGAVTVSSPNGEAFVIDPGELTGYSSSASLYRDEDLGQVAVKYAVKAGKQDYYVVVTYDFKAYVDRVKVTLTGHLPHATTLRLPFYAVTKAVVNSKKVSFGGFGFDWSDIKTGACCSGVSFDLAGNKLVLELAADFDVDPSIVYTTGSASWNDASSRNSFRAADRFWVVVKIGSTQGIYTSSDGVTWTYVDSYYSVSANAAVFFDGVKAHIAVSSGSNVYYRSFTPASDGSITWTAGTVTAYQSSVTVGFVNVTTDSTGHVWLAVSETSNFSTFTKKVFRSGNTDGTWGTTSYSATVATESSYYGCILPLTAGKMVLVTPSANSSPYLNIYVFNGSSWTNAYTTSTALVSQGYFSAVTYGDAVYFAFTGASYIYCQSFDASTGTFGSLVQIQSWTGNAPACALTIDPENGNLYVSWANKPTANAIYYKPCVGGVWGGTVHFDTDTSYTIGASKFNADYWTDKLFLAVLYLTTTYYARHAFVKLPACVVASAGPNGSINPSGYVQVPAGNDQTFSFTPDSGYKVHDVVVDGVSQGAVPSYTFTSIDANHTISVAFEVAISYVNVSDSVSMLDAEPKRNKSFGITDAVGSVDSFGRQQRQFALSELISTVEALKSDKSLSVNEAVAVFDGFLRSNRKFALSDLVLIAESLTLKKNLKVEDLASAIEVLTANKSFTVADFAFAVDNFKRSTRMLPVTDLLSASDSLKLGKAIQVSDLVAFAESVKANKSFLIAEVATLIDGFNVVKSINVADFVELIEAFACSKNLFLGEAANLTDKAAVNKDFTVTDLAEVVDSISRGKRFAVSDVAAVIDSPSTVDKSLKVVDEAVLAEALGLGKLLQVVEAAVLTEYLRLGKAVKVADVVVLAEFLRSSKNLTIVDIAQVADAVLRNKDVSLVDEVFAFDEALRGRLIAIYEAASVVDSLVRNKVLAFNDAVALVDGLLADKKLFFSEHVGAVDASQVNKTLSLTDVVTFAELLKLTRFFNVPDAAYVADFVEKTRIRLELFIADAVGVADGVFRNKHLAFEDVVVVAEAVAAFKALRVFDSATLQDVALFLKQLHVNENICLFDPVTVPFKVKQVLDGVCLFDGFAVNKVLQLSDEVYLAEVVSSGLYRLKLIIGFDVFDLSYIEVGEAAPVIEDEAVELDVEVEEVSLDVEEEALTPIDIECDNID